MLIENNWNVKRHDLCECKVGDVYRPWYFYKTKLIGVPRDIPYSSIVYWIGEGSMLTNYVACTSFQYDYRGKGKARFLDMKLVQDIKENGQKVPADCITHCSDLSVPGLIEDPQLELTHVFEGHHRLMACEHLGIDIRAKDFRVYDMPHSWSWEERYNSIYTDTFWSGWTTADQRKPWFSFESFSKPLDIVDRPVAKCLNRVRSMNLLLSRGVDLGCAEGLYTMNAASYLGIPMHGIDMEPGRILRALMVRHMRNGWDTTFRAGTWGRGDYSGYDFAIVFSILHHCEDQEKSFGEWTKGKKAMAVEVRVADEWKDVNTGSIKRIGPQGFYEGLFTAEGFTWELMHSEGDRRWYVLWKERL